MNLASVCFDYRTVFVGTERHKGVVALHLYFCFVSISGSLSLLRFNENHVQPFAFPTATMCNRSPFQLMSRSKCDVRHRWSSAGAFGRLSTYKTGEQA